MTTEVYTGYRHISDQVLQELADRHRWIVEPIFRASSYVRKMPFFEFVQGMRSHHDFKPAALQLYHHSATFPKVMGLMLGLTPMSENHMMPFYAEHAFGEGPHHRMLFDWMLHNGVILGEEEVRRVIPTVETNACVNLAYQMAIEQDRDKWLVALNCGIERCSNDFFKVVAPKMYELGVGHAYFDVHVEADEHHSIMGLDHIHTDLSAERQRVLIAKALEGITLWAAMLHSWIGITAVPAFDLDGMPIKRATLTCH
ncbi:iron-containing redox enzyme family protein [Parachitinimonas caeni]|uniref:Iron-containing redox enzyme family protein n=1 Tax=Parachitinimonas caeni TaxID=3031301 RepID=A0ABT7E3I3_9NEIS|nr:iron-containing redox enzyme family protein [Parachitinimonas caeni]MDK2125965.1 iron-containing redox enzyme family protein [Parachitinimonas caeni]